VWVVSRGSAPMSPPTLTRIDPSRNAVAETIPLEGTAPIGMAAGASSLWVSSRNLGEVVRIGPLPLPAPAPATGGPPAVPIAPGAGIVLVLVIGEVLRRSARPHETKPVPNGRLLTALLLRQQASEKTEDR